MDDASKECMNNRAPTSLPMAACCHFVDFDEFGTSGSVSVTRTLTFIHRIFNCEKTQ
jgi:hypothetical protein